MGDRPNSAFDAEKQLERDLTLEGIKIAREAASKYFDKLQSGKYNLYSTSSNEVRALENAKI